MKMRKLFCTAAPMSCLSSVRHLFVRLQSSEDAEGSRGGAEWLSQSWGRGVEVSCLFFLFVVEDISFHLWRGKSQNVLTLHSIPLVSSAMRSLQAKRARLLHRCHQLLVEHGEGRVGREVQAVKASVSPAEIWVEKNYQGGYSEM